VKPEIILGSSGSTNRYPKNPYPNITTAVAAHCSQITITCWPAQAARPTQAPTPRATVHLQAAVMDSRSRHAAHALTLHLQTPASRRRRATSPLSRAPGGSQAPKPQRLNRPRRRRRHLQPPSQAPKPPTSTSRHLQAEPGSQARRRPGRSRTPSCSCHPG
jgi:hypothetical protein